MNIQIPGVSSFAITKIVEYSYLRTCDLTEKNVYEILVVADYVAMLGLVQLCVEFLTKSLSSTNCVGIMRFAIVRENKDLYNMAHLYVLRNFEHVAANSEQLMELPMEELYTILNDDLLNVRDEYLVWQCILRWIEYDRETRKMQIPKLLSAIRLGCLNATYFMENIMNHKYVVNNAETQPIILEVLGFLEDLNDLGDQSVKIVTPRMAVPRIPHDVIFLTGGWQSRPVAIVETYDTRADRWVNVPQKPNVSRCYHGTAVIGTLLYMVGGFDGRNFFNTCCVFDAVNKTWREISPMHTHRSYVSVTELNGFIYALGGFDGTHRLNTCERYDPITNQWTLIPSMNVIRSDAHACTIDGKIYIAGGFDGQMCLDSAECYDPDTNLWLNIPPMTSRRSGVSCIGFKGWLFVMGGFDGTFRLKTCEKFNTKTNEWSTIPEMTYERSNFGIEILDDMIFVIGGYNGIIKIPFNECYNTENNQWYNATVMSKPRAGHKANVVKGLPNVTDYIYKHRDHLIEERRLSIRRQ
ncbi:kelch-like protein 10 isoform X2 [Bradysia coprophila]|nr:kelch-like protein 10 isoform X2 [Bradysia coprophila]